jgi:hypothetical protein
MEGDKFAVFSDQGLKNILIVNENSNDSEEDQR